MRSRNRNRLLLVYTSFFLLQCYPNHCPTYEEANYAACDFSSYGYIAAEWIAGFLAWLFTEAKADDWIAVFTFILMGATIALWVATRQLFVGAERTSKSQLRAYVNVSKKTLENVVQLGNPRFVLTSKNFGQTPALNVRTLHGMRIVDADNLGGFYIRPINPNPKEGSASVVPPGACEKSHSFLHDSDRKRKCIDAELWVQMTLFKKKRISIDGLIEYEDVFGQRHWTKFRFLSSDVGQKAGMRWAPNGNQVGTYDKNEKSALDEWIEGGLAKIGTTNRAIDQPPTGHQ